MWRGGASLPAVLRGVNSPKSPSAPYSGRIDPEIGGEERPGRPELARDLDAYEGVGIIAVAARPGELHPGKRVHVGHEPLGTHDAAAVLAEALGMRKDRGGLGLGGVAERIEAGEPGNEPVGA